MISGAVQYANERIQFIQPLLNLVQFVSKLAEMATSCYAGETFTVLLKILKIVSLLVKQKEFSSRSRIKG
jgi:hypothetical protein